jgi:tetratricopeptide (TPR) repeat protein
MAAFIGRRGDVDKAFALLDQARKSAPVTAILPIGLECLRLNPDKASKEKFQLLESWAKTATQEESNPQQVKMLLAELYDLAGRSQEAIQIYREMLSEPRIDPTQKALVKNNLAFLLAMVKGSPDSATEAVKLISEAMRVLGPTADLLDTRAVALLSQGKTQQAISDLTLAVTDSPSSSKYFHLAQAQKRANNIDAARESLAKAQQSGVDAGQLGTAEKELYKQLVDELK